MSTDRHIPDDLYRYFGKQPPTPTAPPPAAAQTAGNGTARNGDHTAYIGAAHTAELAELAHSPHGARNHTLNIVALKLARLPIDRDQLRDDLIQSCHTNGLIRDDGRNAADATITSAFNKADRDGPRTLPPPAAINPHITQVTEVTHPAPDNPSPDAVWGSHPPVDAANYLFDLDDTTIALWGDRDDILWAEGEALMIAGGMGLGKTTFAGQLIRAQLGLDTTMFGLPIAPAGGKILYLAMDRPRQIRRSLRRQFDETERDHIAGRFDIRIGPPIADLAANPTLLTRMADTAGAAIIYLDSLKDAAIGLSSDEVGAAYNRARQHTLANNCQICELHHVVKRNPHGGPPTTLADIYGSNWLTAGAGSVILLTGEPGDAYVGFRHVKQPFSEVGPWRLLHNQDTGQLSIDHQVDILVYARAAGRHGLTAHGIAAAMFDKEKPNRSQIEKARRRLDRLAAIGQLVCIEGLRGGGDDRTPTKFYLPE